MNSDLIKAWIPHPFERLIPAPFTLEKNKVVRFQEKINRMVALLLMRLKQMSLKGSNCQSNISIQKTRADKFKTYEKKLNKEIKEFFDFNWDKLPIPLALKELMGRAKTLPKSV